MVYISAANPCHVNSQSSHGNIYSFVIFQQRARTARNPSRRARPDAATESKAVSSTMSPSDTKPGKVLRHSVSAVQAGWPPKKHRFNGVVVGDIVLRSCQLASSGICPWHNLQGILRPGVLVRNFCRTPLFCALLRVFCAGKGVQFVEV